MSPSVLVTGHYGFTNTGDEAILLSMVSHLRELCPGIRVVVTSGSPAKTAATLGVQAIQWYSLQALREAVAECDLVIIGGGGLFHDYREVDPEAFLTDNHSGLGFFSSPVVLASLYEKPVMLYAVGIGPLFSEHGRKLTQFACANAAAITVRDSGSKEILESIGVAARNITVTADPTFGMPIRKDADLIGYVQALRTSSPVIAVAPRYWNTGVDQEFWETELARALDRFLADRPGTLLFIPLQRIARPNEDDAHTAESIKARMRAKNRAEVMTCDLSPQQVQTVLSECDLVVGMRLHSTILAMSVGVPLVGLSYDPKVENIMGQAGLRDFVIDLGSMDAPKLADLMCRALAEQPKAPVECFARQARENARIAVEILTGARRADRAPTPIQSCEGVDSTPYEVRRLLAALERQQREFSVREQGATGQVLGLQGEVAGLEEDLRRASATVGRLKAENADLQLKLKATIAQDQGRAADLSRATEVVRSLEAEKADLGSRLNEKIAHLQGAIAEAEHLRMRTVAGIDRFHHRFRTELDVYRSQRAWTSMVALRKGYTLLKHGGLGAFLRWAVGLPFKGAGNLAPFELNFPQVWNHVPESLLTPLKASQGNSVEFRPARKYDLVVFAIFDFEFRFQRPQQIAAEFARRGHRIFWVSPSRLLDESGERPYEVILLRDNIWEVRLRGPRPDLYGGTLTTACADAYATSLERLLCEFHSAEACSLVQFPYWRQAALALREKSGAKIAYDCMDHWESWTAEPRIGDFSLQEQRRLTRDCDVFVASSPGLGRLHQEEGANPLVVPNGADYDFFASHAAARRESAGSRPVIGYYGAIADWFDLELITEVARARPQYSFVLIGQVHAIDVSGLKALPNVQLLGEKHYREIPGYLSSFGVALIPFKVNELTRVVDPVKVYEYFSQGKPVVATAMQELKSLADLLYTGLDAQDFARQVDCALKENNLGKQNQRMDFARKNTWSARVADIDAAVSACFPLVSILIVTYNCQEFIDPCLDSLLRNTSWPNYEVIVVDNASSDGSAERAAEFAACEPRIRLVRSSENLGFAGANNVAAQRAKGAYLLLLNPDTMVTPGWVGRMVRHAEIQPGVGAVAAVTNFSGNETKVNFEYSNAEEMETFALRRAGHRHAIDIDMAPLFCVLVSSSAWKAVGELDPQFKTGMFEDDDYSLRLKQAGYRVVAAEDCFVHHFGNGSFAKIPTQESLRIFEENRKRFENKWKLAWKPHTLRPGVCPPHHEVRFVPKEFVQPNTRAPRQEAERMVLRRLHPAATRSCEVFNPQPDGSAAIVAECANAIPGTVIVFGDALLPTAYGGPSVLSALVSPELFSKPGRFPVHLLSGLGRSNQMDFEVVAPE
jgi:polysaccharide pyruvyl transferase CsaB